MIRGLVGLGLTLPFALGVKGLGGVFSSRFRTSSRVGFLDMVSSRLDASNEKVERTKTKIGNIERMLTVWRNSNPCSIRIERDAKAHYIIARIEKDAPAEIAWEAVEAVGHLRGALDKIVVELVDANGHGTSGVGFPFGGMSNGKPDPFPTSRMESGIKKKLTPEQWDIIAAQKPYPGGNNLLWAINEIANTDKHRRGLVKVIPDLQSGHGFGGIGQWSSGRNVVGPTDCDFILKDKEREKVLLAHYGGARNLQIQSAVSVHVVFGNIEPVQGRELVNTIGTQTRLTEAIISDFEQFFI